MSWDPYSKAWIHYTLPVPKLRVMVKYWRPMINHRAKGSSSSNAKGSKDTLTVNEDETKLKTDLEIKQRTAEKGKCLAESDKISKEPDITKHPSKVKGNSDEECPPENIFEKLSSSKTTELHKNTSSSASSSFKSTSPSPSSNPLSSKSTLSGFRIPKRCSKSQDESNQTSPSSSSSSINVKQEPSPNSCIANFKIPKRTKSMSCESSSADVTKPTHVKCMGQKLTTSLNSGVEQKLLFSNFTSPSKSITHSSCAAESVGSSLSHLSSVRPHMQENLQRRNSLNSSSTASVTDSSSVTGCHTISGYTTTAAAGPCVTNSSSVTRSIAKNITGVTHSHTTTANTAAPGVTNSRSSTTCHAKKVSDMPCSHTRTSNALTPFTKVAPLIDHLKPVVGKEQRRSNIEIIKMLHEKKRCMREEMSGDGKGSSSARPGHSGVTDASALPRKGIHVSEKSPTCSRPGHSGVTDATALPRKGIHVSDKSPTCSRPGHSGVTNATALPRKEIHVSDKSPALPVAIVKPSPQIPSVTVNESSLLPCNSLENSPVKSIASGIITAHSHNTREFKRVRSESDPQKTVGINPSGPHTEHEAATRKHDGMVTGATDDRDQQRKLGIVRVQRHEQIVDEVKLALKPFFKQGEITKDDYKLIMRKSVEKIKESSSSVDRDRVCRLVKKYIKKIKGVSP
ncbi:hypothetical protein OS493_011267 [Desmophyllum pertusum]|uniref:SFR19-like C-terminal domain-containing protein n=1 Tax=Desmophyllum pertusum TaxID=174260 RepID=A0A9W9Z4L5_9CNID|nr:hypothetical protein OS493_011267 [Desmophyllum pertusum]